MLVYAPFGHARLEEEALDRGRRLGALRRVLEQHRVADREVRAGEARDLVVGVVPRHDPEHDADRAAADQRRALALGELDLLVREQRLGVVGVVLVDGAAEVDLAERLLDRLAHLADDDLAEPLAVLDVQLADAADERGALRHGGRARPLAVGLVGGVDRRLQVGVADGVVRLHELAGRRVDDCVVGHEASHVRSRSRSRADPQALVGRDAHPPRQREAARRA